MRRRLMDFTAVAAACPHVLIAFDKAAVRGFLEQSLQLVQHILAKAVAERRNSGETRLRIRTVQRRERQAYADFLLNPGIRFDAAPLAQ